MADTLAPIVQSLVSFCNYALIAVFIQNAVLGRALGVSRLVKLVDDGEMNSITFCTLLCIVQVIAAPLAWVVNRTWLSSYVYRDYVRPLVLISCTIVAFVIVIILAAALLPTSVSRKATEVLPMATFNCCILGTLLITTIQGFTLAQTFGFAIGSAVGYTGVVFLLTEGKKRIVEELVPEDFRGLPISIIYLAILSLAIYGLTGNMLSF